MEDVREYFKFYIGQECSYPDTDGKIVKAILTGVTTDQLETTYKRKRNGCYGDYLSFKSNGYHNSDALHLKLHLRRLDSMTEEEARECYNMVERKYPGRGFIANPKCSITDYTFHADWSIFQWSIAFPYLLSKGFWLFGDEAFDKGLIIDSKTLNKEV